MADDIIAREFAKYERVYRAHEVPEDMLALVRDSFYAGALHLMSAIAANNVKIDNEQDGAFWASLYNETGAWLDLQAAKKNRKLN